MNPKRPSFGLERMARGNCGTSKRYSFPFGEWGIVGGLKGGGR